MQYSISVHESTEPGQWEVAVSKPDESGDSYPVEVWTLGLYETAAVLSTWVYARGLEEEG